MNTYHMDSLLKLAAMIPLRVLLMCFTCLSNLSAQAQATEDEKAAVAVINRLFNGMELGDSSIVSSCFYKDVTVATIHRDADNNPRIDRESSVDGFLKAVGTPHADIWYEEIWDLKVTLDGDFAQAWCDYAFYAGNKFSHCGVDAFQLHRDKDGWKIFHLADTRRNTGCVIPKKIQQKHTQ